MKKTVIGLTLAASLCLAACGNTEDEVVVSTASGDITKAEFYEQIKELAGETLLEQVVLEKILEDKYDVSDDEVQEQIDSYKEQYGDQFESVLASSGYTEESLKQSIRFQMLQQKAVEDVEVTDEEINTYYEQGKYKLHVRHILVDTEDEATQLYESIKEGTDFATVAKENSLDTDTAENGGDLDWLTVSDMDPAFANAAYALEVNAVSEPVETASGFEIIQLVEKQEIEDYASLEDQKEDITAAVKEQKVASIEWETVEAKLLKETKVTIKDADLKGAFGLDETEESTDQ
jgi:foldase protein PrsA